MPFVISLAAAPLQAAAIATAAATATLPQPVCYYVPTNHVYWDRIETVVEVVCMPPPQPLK